MTIKMKIIEETILKQSTINSSEIEDPKLKETVKVGQEFELDAWEKTGNVHIKATLANTKINGKNTWYAYEKHIQIFKDGQEIPLSYKGLHVKFIKDTVIKQEPVNSDEIEDSGNKQEISSGTELELHSWKKGPHVHIKIALDNQEYKSKNTWYAFMDHIEIYCGSQKLPLEENKTVGEVTSCSTEVLQELDQQIIEELNSIAPQALISFETLDINPRPGVRAYLQPGAKQALAHALQEKGEPVTITSAYRTVAQQQVLYNHWRTGRCGIPIAAKPGDSRHQNGRSIDLPEPENMQWRSALENYGWQWFGEYDPYHFNYEGGETQDYRSHSILAFQKCWNRYNSGDQIAEDGVFGSTTHQRLNRSPIHGFNKTIGNARILRLQDPPMQGQQVVEVQKALSRHGFDAELDGVYDAQTKAIVKQFQEQWNLNVDGIVGPETLSSLGLYCEMT